MAEAPKRIWAESVEGKWRNGSWAAKPEPDKFPDEREFVRADIADGYREALTWAATLFAERESIATVDPDMPRGYGLCQIEQDCYASIKEALAKGDET